MISSGMFRTGAANRVSDATKGAYWAVEMLHEDGPECGHHSVVIYDDRTVPTEIVCGVGPEVRPESELGKLLIAMAEDMINLTEDLKKSGIDVLEVQVSGPHRFRQKIYATLEELQADFFDRKPRRTRRSRAVTRALRRRDSH